MAQSIIFGPFFAMILLTLVVWVYMYARRLHFIASQHIDPQDFATPSALPRQAPAAVTAPSDNLRNLFEVPVLFYALVIYLFVTNQVDAAYVAAAWIFVVFRALHSAVHSTFNRVTLRFGLYMVSTGALWFIAIRAALGHFAAPT
ncbi:MAG TPA: MAPEG family protein [Steroidobacteraceae bacterium]|nr:MAPEG family protein [Steroidobacteraceae bacterium]